MNIFLEPMSNILSKLEKGMSFATPIESSIEVRAFLFAVSCDLPACSAVLNINQHNGERCCIKCYQNGQNHRTGSGGNVRIFQYNTEHPNPAEPKRTHESLMLSVSFCLRETPFETVSGRISSKWIKHSPIENSCGIFSPYGKNNPVGFLLPWDFSRDS
jgi:hypothetical protein